MERIDEIAATPGVDVLFIGTSDLSFSLGLRGDQKDPRLQRGDRESPGRGQAAREVRGPARRESGTGEAVRRAGIPLVPGADGHRADDGRGETLLAGGLRPGPATGNLLKATAGGDPLLLFLLITALAVDGVASLAGSADAARGGLQCREIFCFGGFLHRGAGGSQRIGVFRPGILVFGAAAGLQQFGRLPAGSRHSARHRARRDRRPVRYLSRRR